MKSSKGTVTVVIRRNMLAIQLPRNLFNGKQTYIYLGLPDTPNNRKAAEARASAIASDIAFDRFDPTLERYRPTATNDNSPTLLELWDKYAAYKAKHLSKTTIDKDFKRIRNHINEFPGQRLTDARRIKSHLTDKFTADTVKKILMYVKACCDWAVDEELINSNPFKTLKISGGKKRQIINPFTRSEVDIILAALDEKGNHYTSFVEFLFFTGCRTSEAIGLQWKHISPDMKTITFSEALVLKNRKETKTGTIRKFPVNRQLKGILDQVKGDRKTKPDDLVFLSPTGLAIDSHNFLNRTWKPLLKEIGIDYRSQYTTRHTFISHCLEAGVSVQQVADWVGNSSRTIWQHYAGISKKRDVPIFEYQVYTQLHPSTMTLGHCASTARQLRVKRVIYPKITPRNSDRSATTKKP